VQILAVFEKNVYRLFFGLKERKKNGVPMHPENVGFFISCSAESALWHGAVRVVEEGGQWT
jgi:hypothetical protein